MTKIYSGSVDPRARFVKPFGMPEYLTSAAKYTRLSVMANVGYHMSEVRKITNLAGFAYA